ncbi:MAG TPA: thioredoxin family protein, partial [Leptospiraceae bacterium]|nr:thioredoxin family protein [Leptospiraceae bacterium]
MLHSDPLKEALRPYELREIDATSDDIWPDLQKLGIQSVPTLILIRGGQVRVLRGYANMPISALTQFLNAT